jgi:hypothetical protein
MASSKLARTEAPGDLREVRADGAAFAGEAMALGKQPVAPNIRRPRSRSRPQAPLASAGASAATVHSVRVRATGQRGAVKAANGEAGGGASSTSFSRQSFRTPAASRARRP